jgi:hypothetical protein
MKNNRQRTFYNEHGFYSALNQTLICEKRCDFVDENRFFLFRLIPFRSDINLSFKKDLIII